MTDNMFSDGSTSAYAQLPVPAAWLDWRRGDAKLSVLRESDPGLFFGGWRAFCKDRNGEELPTLPLPRVKRASEDGKHFYEVYATNVLSFLPIRHRTRFELRQKVKDPETGRDVDKIIQISQEKRPNFAPYRQVFGLVFAPDYSTYAPGVIKVYRWSTFISFVKTGEAWNKVNKRAPEGTALIRRYGSIGRTMKDGTVIPHFETFNQGQSTPIEAIGLDAPKFLPIQQEWVSLYEMSEGWAVCPRWNAEGPVVEDADSEAKDAFYKKCAELRLTDDEIGQFMKEAGGDYAKALAILEPPEPSSDDINDALAKAQEQDEAEA